MNPAHRFGTFSPIFTLYYGNVSTHSTHRWVRQIADIPSQVKIPVSFKAGIVTELLFYLLETKIRVLKQGCSRGVCCDFTTLSASKCICVMFYQQPLTVTYQVPSLNPSYCLKIIFRAQYGSDTRILVPSITHSKASLSLCKCKYRMGTALWPVSHLVNFFRKHVFL